MSSPPAAAADEATGVNPVDEEMTNANDEPMDAAPLQNGNGNAEMETEEQSTEKIAAAAQHANVNRKDATLREFLGRMDEFAPIVCLLSLSCLHHLSHSIMLISQRNTDP